ncbi:MAG: ArsB/NhaD family transporter [Patescibacteria group bacterium]
MIAPIETTTQIFTAGSIAALLLFLATYAVIISERVHRTIIALFGAATMIILGIMFEFYDQHSAVSAVDFNTIGLLIGMMIIVTITKHSGLFQYVAIKAAKLAGGDPWKILLLFALITAVFSALLDNVTTVLLMAPMTLVICANLKINPIPLLITQILVSNIGGAATLIGDPPNILIGSAAGLSFMDFVANLGPIVVVLLVVLIPLFKWYYKDKIKTEKQYMERILKMKEADSIKDRLLMKKSIFVLALVMLGFLLHGVLGLEGATIAIFGGALLLLLDDKHFESVLHEIEWTTIFFFVGLFILVGGLEHVGVMGWAADQFLQFTNGSLTTTAIVILWSSAIFSAFIDNIPFVATMIPLVENMHATFGDLNPLWWALALGADLGGNGTLIGASANLIVADIAKKADFNIGFKEFMKVGLVVMVITVTIAMGYIWLRYL